MKIRNVGILTFVIVMFFACNNQSNENQFKNETSHGSSPEKVAEEQNSKPSADLFQNQNNRNNS